MPCSQDTGKLVQRIAPALDKKREVKKQTTKKRNTAKRATVAKKVAKKEHRTKAIKRVTTIGREGFNIEKEAEKIWKLLTPYHKGSKMPRIEMQQRNMSVDKDGGVSIGGGRYAGLAYLGQGKIWLAARPDWTTLAHELTHMAVGTRFGNAKRRAHDKVFYDCLRDIAQRRFKVTISFYEVTRYGYIVDRIIDRQLHQKNVFEIFKKKEQ